MMFAIHPLVEMVPHAIVTMVTQDIIVYVELDIPVRTVKHPQVSKHSISVTQGVGFRVSSAIFGSILFESHTWECKKVPYSYHD
jgi:hypothetical protein